MPVRALITRLIDRMRSKQKAPEQKAVQSKAAEPEKRAPPEQEQERTDGFRRKLELEKAAGGGRAGYELKRGRVKPVEERQQRKAKERGRDGPGR